MPAQKSKVKPINLLPQEIFAKTTLGRVLTWLLSTFRYIVIFVEMIVVIAFLSRFWFDSQITDLNDEIKQKVAIISSFQNFEKQFRSSQTKLSLYDQLATQPQGLTKYTNTIFLLVPPDTRIISVSVNLPEEDIQVKAITTNESSINQYLTNLQTNSLFSSVELTRVNSSTESTNIDFTLKAQISKKT